MTGPTIQRHRTAIVRSDLSRPLRLALADGLISETTQVLDYGCGHGDDLRHLRDQGIACDGWDPVHFPQGKLHPAELVHLGYVINVIDDPAERCDTLRRAWSFARKALVVSARLTIEAADRELAPWRDGCLSRRGTFQKYYEQHELRSWLDETLGVASVPAAPGVFYLFREADTRESFLAARHRRGATTPHQRQSDVVFERHRALFEPLMQFMTNRGRLPDESELPVADEIRASIGSLRRAFRIVQHVTGTHPWEGIRAERAQDLLVYVALQRFDGRPRFHQLPRDLQLDVRAFFATYQRACRAADDLLFSAGKADLVERACQTSPVGKLTPGALYVHASASRVCPQYFGSTKAAPGRTSEPFRGQT